MVGIKPGETASFSYDPSKVAFVVDDTRVECKGVTTPLSALAKELLGRSSDVWNPLHFTYEGSVFLMEDFAWRSASKGKCVTISVS